MNKILFVCVENAGRSQMAEALFNKYAPKSFQSISAGTKPASQINPVVKAVMSEIGIKLSGKPKTLADVNITESTKIINMGCMDKDSCPALDNTENWNIEDPKGKSLDEVRVIRSQIESKIKKLVANLGQ